MFTTKTTTHFLILAAAAVGIGTLPALSMGFEELDANGDGTLSYGEMLMKMPNLTEEVFVSMDTNGDQLIDTAELDAAVEAGVMPVTDG